MFLKLYSRRKYKCLVCKSDEIFGEYKIYTHINKEHPDKISNDIYSYLLLTLGGRQVVLLTVGDRQVGSVGGVAAVDPHFNCLYPFPIRGKRKNNKSITEAMNE